MKLIAIILLLLSACAPTVPHTIPALEVIATFKSSGLEVESPVAMTRADYKFAPYVGTEATHFLIPSLCPDCGGRVFNVPDKADRDLLAAYYVGLGKQSAALYSWVYQHGNIVVQLNGDLPEAKAKEYQAALEGMQ